MSEPLLELSEAAVGRLQDMVDSGRLSQSAIRLQVHEDGAAFRYELRVVGEGESREDDEILESPALRFFVDPESAALLRGARLDYVETLSETGFKFHNPNKPKLLSKPLAARLQQVLDEEVNPSVASHGGQVRLIDVEDGRVYLEFGGGCQGCGMADVTLKQGVEQMLRKAVPEVREVLDTTDHAAGENPYYQGDPAAR